MPAEQCSVGDLEGTEHQRPLQSAPVDLPDYEGLLWRNITRQKFRIPENDRQQLDPWVWKQKHGWRVWDSAGEEYGIARYVTAAAVRTSTGSNPSSQQYELGITRKQSTGSVLKERFRSRRSTIRSGDLISTSWAIMLPLLSGIRLLRGSTCLSSEHYLCSEVVAGNIVFRKVQSPHLRRLISYANPRTHMLSHTSVSKWVAKAYDQQLGVVTQTLASAITKVSLSFDLWTSGNSVALLGIVAHFINTGGKPTSMLLSLPRQRSTTVSKEHCVCNQQWTSSSRKR